MSSYMRMPVFAGDPETAMKVTRVFRRTGYAIDIGEPLIEVSVGEHVHADGGFQARRKYLRNARV